jgi:hypothetical protein
MDAITVMKVFLLGAIVMWAAMYASRALRVWRHYRGSRIVTCPETGRDAAVQVDVGHAIVSRRPDREDVRLESCSRWSERGRCDQPCLPEAICYESAATRIVYAWVQGKTCSSCGTPLEESEGLGHHIALRDASGVSREWVDIATERLRDALNLGRPVCWNCHAAEVFRRTYPELVTDRGSRRG